MPWACSAEFLFRGCTRRLEVSCRKHHTPPTFRGAAGVTQRSPRAPAPQPPSRAPPTPRQPDPLPSFASTRPIQRQPRILRPQRLLRLSPPQVARREVLPCRVRVAVVLRLCLGAHREP